MARRDRPLRNRSSRGGRHEREHSGRAKALTFAGIVVVLLGAVVFLLKPGISDPPVSGASTTVNLSMAGFDPPRLELEAGKTVTLRLVNRDNRFHTDGGGWHQFAIDELGVDVRIAPLGTETVTLTPVRAGTFEFYCDVCCGGRENPYMQGVLVVRG